MVHVKFKSWHFKCLPYSLSQRANAQNVIFHILYGGHFTMELPRKDNSLHLIGYRGKVFSVELHLDSEAD